MPQSRKILMGAGPREPAATRAIFKEFSVLLRPRGSARRLHLAIRTLFGVTMNARRTYFALSFLASSMMVAGSAHAAGPFGSTGGGTNAGPFTPGANGQPSGPFTPGGTARPEGNPNGGPFTPGGNGPSGPFTPAERPQGPATSGPFTNGKKSGGFWGGVKKVLSGAAQVFQKVFDFVAMWDLMGRWFGALIPHGATGTMPNDGTGSNVGRNTNTQPPTMNNSPSGAPSNAPSNGPATNGGNGVNRTPRAPRTDLPLPRGGSFLAP